MAVRVRLSFNLSERSVAPFNRLTRLIDKLIFLTEGGLPVVNGHSKSAPQRLTAPGQIQMKTIVVTLLVAGCFLFVFSGLGTGIDPGHGNIEIANDQGRLALAILNYESRGEGLPPAQIVCHDGTPKHSWRVLILPFLDQKELFERYNMDEPWDSPGNLAVAQELKVPLFSLDQPQLATYKLVTGPKTCFERGKTTHLRDVGNNPVILVEDTQNPIPWTKPDDLAIDEAIAIFDRLNNPDGMLHVDESQWYQTAKRFDSFVGMLGGGQQFVVPLTEPSQMKEHFLVSDGEAEPLDHQIFYDAKPTQYSFTSLGWGVLICLPLSFAAGAFYWIRKTP